MRKVKALNLWVKSRTVRLSETVLTLSSVPQKPASKRLSSSARLSSIQANLPVSAVGPLCSAFSSRAVTTVF